MLPTTTALPLVGYTSEGESFPLRCTARKCTSDRIKRGGLCPFHHAPAAAVVNSILKRMKTPDFRRQAQFNAQRAAFEELRVRYNALGV